MQTFKSVASVEALRDSPLQATLKNLVAMVIEDQPDYRPEDDGYFALIEPGDSARVLSDLDLPWRLSEVPFEGVTMIDGCYHAVYLANNQCGLSFLIPDAEWLPGELRRQLEENLDP